jgi:hypothetical protein
VNDFILNVLPSRGTTILFGQPWDSFLPPLAGSFLGVILAFAANYAYQLHIAHEDKIKYINIIRSEIFLCISVLELDKVQILPVDRWNLTINSGGLKYFDVDMELQSLCLDYYRIRDYNDKAIDYLGDKWMHMENTELLSIREWLLTELKELEEVDWLSSASKMDADEADAYRKALQDGLRSP